MAAPVWTSDQVNQFIQTQGTPVAGILGSPTFPRVTEIRGILKVYKFNIEQDTPNPLPGLPPGAIVSGDSIIIAQLSPIDRIYFGRIYFNSWSGTAILMSVGKYDPNTGAEDDAHYLSATDIDAAGSVDLNLNMMEQVGTDPQGDQSVGNAIPDFGAQKVDITITLAAGAFGVDGTISGFLMIVEEGN